MSKKVKLLAKVKPLAQWEALVLVLDLTSTLKYVQTVAVRSIQWHSWLVQKDKV
jgi:hypothetical protein